MFPLPGPPGVQAVIHTLWYQQIHISFDPLADNTSASIPFSLTMRGSSVHALACAIVSSASVFSPPTALANHCGWGDITCPPSHWRRNPLDITPRSSGQSCFSTVTDERYSIRIRNATRNTLNFSLADNRYSLAPGSSRVFTPGKRYGTNSCNITTYNPPVILFDFSFANGFQSRRYDLPDGSYSFSMASSDSVDLYRD